METDYSTKDILTHHLTAFGDNDLEEILKDYTERSVILTREGTIQGIAKIRYFFEGLFKLIPTGSFFEMMQLSVVDNVAHIIWKSSSETARINLGTDTFFMEENKILFHTVAVDFELD